MQLQHIIYYYWKINKWKIILIVQNAIKVWQNIKINVTGNGQSSGQIYT